MRLRRFPHKCQLHWPENESSSPPLQQPAQECRDGGSFQRGRRFEGRTNSWTKHDYNCLPRGPLIEACICAFGYLFFRFAVDYLEAFLCTFPCYMLLMQTSV